MPKLFSKVSFDRDTLGLWFMVLFGFSLPLSVAVNNIFAALIILLWLYRGSYHETWTLIKRSRVATAVMLFIFLHVLAMLWTEDIEWGLIIIKKECKLLLIPIMMSLVRREHTQYYISAFLLAISISELLSYLIWFEAIPPFLHATIYDPTPFIHHTSYNPLLAFAIYLTGYYLLFNTQLNKLQKVLLAFFFITMSINMFITGGRAGQVGYLVVLTILFFQYFDKHFLITLLLSAVVLGGILFTAYSSSQIFRDRVDLAGSDIKNFDKNKNTSVGLRMNFALNSMEIIKENPWFGVGTGDFKNSYVRVNAKNTPSALVAAHPHNMYLLEMVQFGLLGLLSLLAIFYFQIRFALHAKDDMCGKIGMALPLLFMVIMLSDSYLLGHYTTMLFVFFSAFLYRPLNETDE